MTVAKAKGVIQPDEGPEALATRIRACRVCAKAAPPLPHVPRPVLRVSATATLCVASQAPGTKVHASGLPFDDASGDRLRTWMGIDRPVFYDVSRIAITPMGFCFPGQDPRGADLPPRPECRALWHDRLFAALPQLRLVLAIGLYAQAYHLGRAGLQPHRSLTERVADWRATLAATSSGAGPAVLPLPHPSWRNNGWIRKNPWFEAELLPFLRETVRAQIGGVGPIEE